MTRGDVMDCDAFKDDMMDVLYGEGDAAARRRFTAHEAACPACRQEIAALRRGRRDLGRWSLPAPLRPAVRHAAGAAWLAAAAAVFLVALGGLVLSGSEVRYENGHLQARIGRAGASDVRALLAAQDERHRREMEALR